jgi:hypothetical protein
MFRRVIHVLRSLAGNGRPDDLCALIDATREPLTANPGHAEAAAAFAECDALWDQPLTRAALANLRDTLADWHDEVWALADVELAEMTREGL